MTADGEWIDAATADATIGNIAFDREKSRDPERLVDYLMIKRAG